MMHAVITTGGKQYFVAEGETIQVEKLMAEPGEKLSFDAMLVTDAEGTDVRVGTPLVPGVKVSAVVTEHGRGDKISVIKYKRKARYRRNVGHRQPFTMLTIEKIA
jgi:large subunit ribosomal protein L21